MNTDWSFGYQSAGFAGRPCLNDNLQSSYAYGRHGKHESSFQLVLSLMNVYKIIEFWNNKRIYELPLRNESYFRPFFFYSLFYEPPGCHMVVGGGKKNKIKKTNSNFFFLSENINVLNNVWTYEVLHALVNSLAT